MHYLLLHTVCLIGCKSKVTYYRSFLPETKGIDSYSSVTIRRLEYQAGTEKLCRYIVGFEENHTGLEGFGEPQSFQ